MKRFWFRRGLRFLGFALLFVGLTGFVVMSLWNALLPPILGVPVISFWQALGLLVLSRILFGGPRGFGFGWRGGYGPRRFGRRGFGGHQFGHREFGSRQAWKQKMAERWQQMTPEQREQMKQDWRAKCGSWGRSRWGAQPEQPEQEEPSTTAI